MSYAGDITVDDAWRMLSEDPKATLVDVRTQAEWTYVGLPDLSEIGKSLVRAEWQTFPGGAPNPRFLDQVAQAGVEPDAKLLLICRSGGRSKAAAIALTGQGYAECYNVAGGFEGDLDQARHRGSTGGWKAAGLPWVQS